MLSALTGTVRSRVFFLCYLCYGVVYFARKPFSIIKSEMADTLGLSTAALGYIDTAFLVAYAGGQFFVPRLGDKYSARPVMFGGMLGAAVASAFFSVSSSPQALIFWYFVNGLAQSGLYATCVSALTHVFDSTTKGTVLGTWSTCQNLGSFFAATMASALMGSTGEYLTCLYASSIIVGSSALVVAAFMPDMRTVPRSSSASATIEMTEVKSGTAGGTSLADGPGGGDVTLPMVMRVPGVLPLGVAYFFIKTVRYILLFWLPYYLHVQQGFAVPVAGYLSTVFDLGSIVGAVSLGWLTDRFARRQRTVVTTLTAVALGVNLLFFDAIAALGVLPCGLALALLGMLVAGPDSSIPGAAVQDVMERAGGVGARGVGTAVGLVQGMGSIGTATQGFLVSAIVAHGGWQGLFPSLVVLCVSASLVLLPTVAREAKVL